VYNGREDPEQIFQFEISCTDYSAAGVYSGILPMVHCKGRSSMATAIAVIFQHTPARLAAYSVVLRQVSQPSQSRVPRRVCFMQVSHHVSGYLPEEIRVALFKAEASHCPYLVGRTNFFFISLSERSSFSSPARYYHDIIAPLEAVRTKLLP
jgi:hypothetical protein